MKLATQSKSVPLVQYLMTLGFRERLDHDDFADLFICTGEVGDYPMTKFYLELGIDINVTNSYNETLFHVACCSPKDNVQFLKWLLKQGSDMNFVDGNGCNGFHNACLYGNLNIVKCLVEKGVDIKLTNFHGNTAFIYSCLESWEESKLDIIQYLLQKGIDVNLPGSCDETGLQILIDHLSTSKYVLRSLCILTLIEHGEVSLDEDISSDLLLLIKQRIVEITFMKDHIFQIFEEPVAETIIDFTMLPIQNTSLQNLLNFLDKFEQYSF
jgi:ankyrin repeat protein